MQILQVFAVYDKKGTAYTFPHFNLTVGRACRAFEDAVNDKTSAFYKHPEDFNLQHLGEFNDSTGKITSMANPIIIEEALNLKAPEKN